MMKYILVFAVLLTGFGLKAQEKEFIIRPGDVLSIEVMEHPEFNRANILVLPDGTIQYPALGSLHVAGKSPATLADTLQKVLDVKYVINPLVTVYVNQIYNESVNVFGGVNHPGRFQLFEPMELMMVIGMAGGLTDTRYIRDAIIIRKDGSTERYNLKKILKSGKISELDGVLISAEDTVIVEEKKVNWSQLAFIGTVGLTIVRIIELFI